MRAARDAWARDAWARDAWARDAWARDAWAREVLGRAAALAARLVFVDETGATTAMARRRARAPRGERAVSAVPRGRRCRTGIGR